MPEMAAKTSPDAPPSCAVLPLSVSHPRAFCQEFFMKKAPPFLLAAPSIYF